MPRKKAEDRCSEHGRTKPCGHCYRDDFETAIEDRNRRARERDERTATLRQLVADLKHVARHFGFRSDPISRDASLLLRDILRKVGPPYYQEDEVAE